MSKNISLDENKLYSLEEKEMTNSTFNSVMSPYYSLRCIFHVVDAYGTEAMYNHPEYSLQHGYKSYYGGLGLDLKQFYTFFRTWNTSIIPFFSKISTSLKTSVWYLLCLLWNVITTSSKFFHNFVQNCSSHHWQFVSWICCTRIWRHWKAEYCLAVWKRSLLFPGMKFSFWMYYCIIIRIINLRFSW